MRTHRCNISLIVLCKSSEMEAQANLLVDRIINDLGVTEFNNEWKLINFFIGGNDLCDVCTYPVCTLIISKSFYMTLNRIIIVLLSMLRTSKQHLMYFMHACHAPWSIWLLLLMLLNLKVYMKELYVKECNRKLNFFFVLN